MYEMIGYANNGGNFTKAFEITQGKYMGLVFKFSSIDFDTKSFKYNILHHVGINITHDFEDLLNLILSDVCESLVYTGNKL